jgi:hypothetical protein
MAPANQPTAEGISLLTPYWSTIVSARAEGYRRYEVWSILQEQFQAGGPQYQGATIFDMNVMWSRAGELLNAEAAFGAANPANPVTSEMWAWAPWTSPTTAAWQTPNYMLNYSYTVRDAEGNIVVDQNGSPLLAWGATDWQGSLDVLGQNIIDRALGSAQAGLDIGSPRAVAQMADLGGLTLGNIVNVQILRF